MYPKYTKALAILIVVIIIYKGFKIFLFPTKSPVGQIIVKDELGKEAEKVKVTVYYEALCPDSKFFITSQLVPTFNQLKDFLIIDLVPYGKAETIIEDGKIDFRCQHDKVECFANKIHSCVIDAVPNPEVQLKYIACMIADNMMPEDAGERCARELELDFSPINKCAIEQEGSLLLKKHGDRTHSLKPQVRFIPTIELNDDQELIPQPEILKNLLKAACKVFFSKPSKCD